MGRKIRKRLLGIAMVASLIISMLPQMSLVAKADTVNLWVCGTQVVTTNGSWSMIGDSGTASFNGSTLTLSNFNYSGTGKDNQYAIYSELEDLTINLVGQNIITHTALAQNCYGIYTSENLTITGDGSLDLSAGTANLVSCGIKCGTLNVTGGRLLSVAGDGNTGSYGIYCSTANFTGGKTQAVAGRGDGSSDSAQGSIGIKLGAGNMIVSGDAEVTAKGGSGIYASCGICDGNVTVNGGSLACIGGNTTYSTGLHADGSCGISLCAGQSLTIGEGTASFIATGNDYAVLKGPTAKGTKNAISGIGWTDTSGTEGAAVIQVSATEQSFDYKKVQFPEVHLSDISATVTGYTGTYDGQAHGITVNVTNPNSGATVKYGTTEETYDLNTAPTYSNAGTYTVYYKITAAGYNSETGSAKVTINKATSSVTTPPVAISGLTATGQAQVLITSGISSGGTMQYALGTSETSAPDSGWSTTLPGATDAGDYYVWYKVVGDDNYEGTDPACVKVTISGSSEKQEEKIENIDKNQKKSSVSTVTAGKKAITLKWKKQIKGGIKGYEIQYSTDKNFKKNVKTITIKKAKITSTTIKKLKSKKKYYVRIRTYKMSGSEKVYSNWSKAKSIKVK